MKNLQLVIFLLLSSISFCFSQTQDIPQGYAIVVGAYAKSQVYLAVQFTKRVSDMGYKARFGLNEGQSLIYVYVDHTASFKEALLKMKEMREKDGFEDTWVHVKTSEARLALTPEEKERAEKTTKVMKDEVVSPLGDFYAEKFKDVQPQEEDTESQNQTKKAEPKDGVKNENVNELKSEEIKVATDDRLGVNFQLYNSTNGNDVRGEIQVIDTEKSKLMDVVESGVYSKIDDPKNGSGQVTLIVDVFGFRKVQKEFNYYNPYQGTSNVEMDSTANGPVIKIDLVRYRKGDIVTMYNVFYYKDAAVMRPESKYEINNLLDMLKENKNMRIKIHGHVNGKNSGPIISVVDNNFFSLSEDNPKGFGSAKKLSQFRAETIKNYLIDSGIAANRMEIKAWGGNRMLHDKHSAKAKENVRVEIEILQD